MDEVYSGEVLWFIENNGDGMVKSSATVKNVFNSDKLSEQDLISLLRIIRRSYVLHLTR